MAHSTSISHVGDKLIVGALDTSFLTGTSRISPGTAVLNGPVYIGATAQAGVARAACMIGPPLPGLSAPASLEVTGITNIIGSLNVPAISNFTGISNFSAVVTMNSLELKNGVDLKNALNLGNATTCSNAPVVVNGPLVVQGPISSAWLEAQLATARALPGKAFDIPHPSRPNTHRLRYVCLEGPEVGAYIRGKLDGTNIIELPSYWKDLVYTESITVNLTPTGVYQELFVEKIEWGTRIIVKNNLGSSIKCDYIIYGERKMKDKLQPEYEGKTPDDYPGDNSEYSLAGWNYDKRIYK